MRECGGFVDSHRRALGRGVGEDVGAECLLDAGARALSGGDVCRGTDSAGFRGETVEGGKQHGGNRGLGSSEHAGGSGDDGAGEEVTAVLLQGHEGGLHRARRLRSLSEAQKRDASEEGGLAEVVALDPARGGQLLEEVDGDFWFALDVRYSGCQQCLRYEKVLPR